MSVSHDFVKAAILSALPFTVDASAVVPVKLDRDCHIYEIDDSSFAVPVINGDLTYVEYDGQFKELIADINKLVTELTLLAVDMNSLAKAIISFGSNCRSGACCRISNNCGNTVKFPFAEFTYVNKNLVLIKLSKKVESSEYSSKVVKFVRALMCSDGFKVNDHVKDLI